LFEFKTLQHVTKKKSLFRALDLKAFASHTIPARMVSIENDWHSNPLRVVALMSDTTCEQRALEVRCAHPLSTNDVIWALMRQNQLMQEENRALRKKMLSLQEDMRSLREENIWASSELDRLHWEHQSAVVELQWMYKQRVSVWNQSTAAIPSPPVETTKTYAQTLQTEDAVNKPDCTSCERCLRHEPSARRERRQCKCCVLEAIYRLVLSAPKDVQDVGEYVASGLVNIPPFAAFWCPGCTKDFVNKTSRRDLEAILHLVERIERNAAPMSELKRRLKPLGLRQRVKCAVHLKS
jgi:hypothetical protein